ncbi:MAG: hypothetical protein L3J66_13140 [Bacteroidales bacterium]|nr:hypothetical protein [Bacteroidales bacterium]
MSSLKNFPVALLIVFSLFATDCTTTDGNANDDPLDKFLGVWQVSDQAARLNYEVVIQRNPANSAELLLENFADLGGTAVGLVVGSEVIIDKQTIAGGYQAEGSGSYISSSRLDFGYELDDGIDKEKRKAVFSR